MDNKDMPAMPAGKIEIDTPKGGDPFGNYKKQANGLTKREYFAGLAMQGLLSADTDCDWSDKDVAIEAVATADSLLAALETKDTNKG